MSSEFAQGPIHLKLVTWAPDKNTGEIRAMILPSIYFKEEETAGFDPEGKFQTAFDAFKLFCERQYPKLKWVGQEE